MFMKLSSQTIKYTRYFFRTIKINILNKRVKYLYRYRYLKFKNKLSMANKFAVIDIF